MSDELDMSQLPDDFYEKVDAEAIKNSQAKVKEYHIQKNNNNNKLHVPSVRIDNEFDPNADPDKPRVDTITWLIQNPDFDERPATIEEFLGPGYLDIDRSQNQNLRPGVGIRVGVKQALIDIFGEDIDPENISVARRAMFSGGIGVGKQFDLGEKILTPNGWVKNCDLKLGDYVVGKNGKPVKVTAIFDNDSVERYRVHFKDGTWINAGADHKWEIGVKTVYRDKNSGKNKRKLVKKIFETRDLYNRDLNFYGQGYKYEIPLVDPVEFNIPFDEVVDAYTLGWYISNGSSSHGSPRIACHSDDESWLDDNLIIKNGHWTKDRSNEDRSGITFSSKSNVSLRRKLSNPFANALDKLGLFGVHVLDKFIPESYLTAPVSVRMELLKGLMDSDGSACGNNSQTFSTSSKLLANDVAELVRGLGGYCTLTSFERMNTEYQVHVNMDQLCPFKMPRKANKWKPRTNQRPHRSIVKVEKIEDGPGRCIMVDAPDHLYVAKDYIVSHNSTLASIALTYMVHWVSCLNDPQGYFELLPGSPIAFMIMSTRKEQAKEVLFGKVTALVENSEWFKQNAMPNQGKGESQLKNQLRFPKFIWLVPGTSLETAFEGYDILGGVIDEMDSHKITSEKDYAESGWSTIAGRIASRFTNPTDGDHRGLLMAMGQMKKQDGFAARKKAELEKDDKAVVVMQTIWESRGWDYYRSKKTGKVEFFYFDLSRKVIVPPLAAEAVQSEQIIKIPKAYTKDFELDPVKALRDLAGIPPAVEDPFISAVDRIDEAQDKWQERYADLKYTVNSDIRTPAFHPDFRATDAIKRVIHVDLAYSSNGDAMGLAMGHIPEIVEVDNELKPYIVIDAVLRMRASGGTPLMLADIRQIIYYLHDDLKFKLGVVTFDGFQSQDSMQIMRQKRYNVDELSVDRNKGPYEDLRQAIYERRIEFPRYMTYLTKDATEKVNIIKKELSELTDVGQKIDHPPKNGSKDCADAIAGVTYVLMGNSAYRRGAARNYRRNMPKMDNDNVPDLGLAPRPVEFDINQGINKELKDLDNISKQLGLPKVEHDPFARLHPGPQV